MAIALVGSGKAANTTSVTVPAHSVGDLILIAAHREGNATPPSLPAGYTSIATVAIGTTYSLRVGYKIATSTSDTSGTWTNGKCLTVQVFSGAQPLSIGSGTATNSGSPTIPNYPAVTFDTTDGSSWAAGLLIGGGASHAPPSGMTLRQTAVSSGFADLDASDTNGGVTGWASTNYSANGSAAWCSVVCEIKETGGGGGGAVTSPQGDIEGGIGDPGVGLPQQGLHAIEKGISARRLYLPRRKRRLILPQRFHEAA